MVGKPSRIVQGICCERIFKEFDDSIRKRRFDDEDVGTDYYGIACCVSAQPIADGVQFFGARANLAKTVLYAINGGIDELTKRQCGPAYAPITSEYIDYDEFMKKFDDMLDWVADIYVNALNAIHYMHDKYYYESAQLALKNTVLNRTFATGISGLSVAADSISAIKYGHVKAIRDEDGVAIDFKADNDFPRYGNNDDRADEIAVWLVKQLYTKMNKHHLYRGAKLSTSVLTITSNVVYGKNTGTTPNGRQRKSVLTRCQPGIRCRTKRRIGIASFGSQDSLQVCNGWHLEYVCRYAVNIGP